MNGKSSGTSIMCGGCVMRVVSVNVGMPREVDWRGMKNLDGYFQRASRGEAGLAPAEPRW